VSKSPGRPEKRKKKGKERLRVVANFLVGRKSVRPDFQIKSRELVRKKGQAVWVKKRRGKRDVCAAPDPDQNETREARKIGRNGKLDNSPPVSIRRTGNKIETKRSTEKGSEGALD